MPNDTTKYAIPWPEPSDPVTDGDDTMRALAERVDFLLGESNLHGPFGSSPADAVYTQRINYSRSYAPLVPRVQLTMTDGLGGATTRSWTLWVTGEDSTGFTLNWRANTTVTTSVRWTARP